MSGHHPTRREFIGNGLAALAATPLLSATDLSPAPSAPGPIPRRTLGKTGEKVTILGLGCAYAAESIAESQTGDILKTALDAGVRYFDAAPEYTSAEERLGAALGPLRDECFLVTKTYAFDAKKAEEDLLGSLERLRTDRVELFLQHGVGLKPLAETERMLWDGGSLEFLLRAKREGLARYIGMSVHPLHPGVIQILDETGDWDVIMTFVNYISRAQDKEKREVQDLFARVEKDHLGLVAMKVLGGNPGLLADDYDRAFRYALSVPGAACNVIGVRNTKEVGQAVRAARAFRPLSGAEMAETIRVGEELVASRSKKVTMLDWHRRQDALEGALA